MAIDWELHGVSFGSCNCDYSCPCQFEALPTNGTCEGNGFMRIDQGHFGDVKLDGLLVGALYAWPGPIFEGKGRCQIIIDERANEAQRDALRRISLGEEADEFSNIFTVYTAMCDTFYDTVYAKIDFEMDMEARRGRCVVEGLGEVNGEPIIGAAGNEHRVQIHLPEGVEFRVAEVGKGQCKFDGEISLDIPDGYGQFTELHLDRHGVMA